MNYRHLRYFWMVARSGGVARAAHALHLTPQTLSGQIRVLEDALGRTLFRKVGRRVELTEDGGVALRYADSIFALGNELEQTLKNAPSAERELGFRVGVADAVPKTLAYRLLEPATQLDRPVRLSTRTGKVDALLADLAVHRLDLAITDAPIPAGLHVRAFNHLLGRSGLSFFAAPALARRCRGRFPASLDERPFLMPAREAAVTSRLSGWLERNAVRPRVVGEFEDGALMKAFGQHGQGVFVAPTALERHVARRYGVRCLGRTDDVIEEFFAISIERRITHPCVAAITAAARDELFA